MRLVFLLAYSKMERLSIGVCLLLCSQAVFGYTLFDTGRIVGGKPAPEGRYPFIASLRMYERHYCGSAIVSSKWLLTAAHCVRGTPPESVIAVVGTNKLNEGGEKYELFDFITHEDYNPWILQSDIALIRIRDLTFNERVQPISVYGGVVGEDVDASIIGWGRTSAEGPVPNDLRYVNVKTLSVATCKAKGLAHPILPSQLCTFIKHGQGACSGDSGGPIITTNANGEDFLVGLVLVSWNHPCATGYPDVHTRVISFRSWLDRNCLFCLNIKT